jgi:hypothetical protein
MNPSLSRAVVVTLIWTAVLLSVPLVAMQFTAEVNWGPGDFMAAGGLLFGAGMAYHVLSRLARTTLQRLGIAALVLAILAIVWAELAVGIFD